MVSSHLPISRSLSSTLTDDGDLYRNKSAWAQKLQTVERRSKLSDFERFSVQLLKKNRRDRVRRALKKESKA